MSEQVQFEDESQTSYSGFRASGETLGALENFVIKTGVAKDKTQANYVLIGVIILFFIITIFIFFGFSSGNKQQPIDKATSERMAQNPLSQNIAF